MGRKHGFGKLSDHVRRITYEGDFHQGKYSGKGKLVDKRNSITYEGDFDNGKYHGDGKFVLREGESRSLEYTGQFKEGKKSG